MPEPFEFPESLLKQIEECSNGGFVLAFIDNEKNVEIALSYDSESVLRALVSKTNGWARGMESVLDQEDEQSIGEFFGDEQQDSEP